jgi:hypothetical protein
MCLSFAAIRTVTITLRSTLAAFLTTSPLEICNPGCSAPCAIIAAPTLVRRGSMANWSRAFEDPIPLPRGRQLVILEDAGTYITKLPKSEHTAAEWQAAMEALILVATLGGPTMFARIGIMQALNRNVERAFDSSRKDAHWGKRKLKRDNRQVSDRAINSGTVELIPEESMKPSMNLRRLIEPRMNACETGHAIGSRRCGPDMRDRSNSDMRRRILEGCDQKTAIPHPSSRGRYGRKRHDLT